MHPGKSTAEWLEYYRHYASEESGMQEELCGIYQAVLRRLLWEIGLAPTVR